MYEGFWFEDLQVQYCDFFTFSTGKVRSLGQMVATMKVISFTVRRKEKGSLIGVINRIMRVISWTI